MTSVSALTLAVIALALILVLWVVWAWLRAKREIEPVADEAYTHALAALISGNSRLALTRLKEAVQQNSENLDAYIRMGDLLRESGEVQKALAVHRDLTVRSRLPESDRVRILESITRDYLAARRYEEAGQSAERLKHVDRNNRFAFRALVRVAEALEDWPRAVRVMEEQTRIAGEGKEDLARFLGFVGDMELKQGDRKSARQRFEEALKLDPECHLAHLQLGDLDREDGELEKAVEQWRQLALDAPSRAGLVFDRLERAFFELGHFGEVVSFYRELLERAPRESAVPALLALAEIHRRKGELEDAETFIREAMEIAPSHPRAHRHWAKLAMDREDPQEALARLDRLLSVLPDEDGPGTCRHCSQPLESVAWRCPHCAAFDPMGM